ncbi:ABC transporter ATP-binding protein [Geminicoccus roseus]|uniref:ABC transporter ATP-binding protein n=1 Tax=Geminicoccus roseus TaxID=404900 RepID=UPI00040A3B14|nr:ABC transporter ATP-binding protein [Geminicoccus roseus]
MAEAALAIEGLVTGYDRRDVLAGISFQVPDGALVTVVGPNGHGKSTLLRAISGLLPTRRGSIRLFNQDLAGLAPHAVAAAGIVHVPQGDMLFPQMSVHENLLMGAYLENDPAVVRSRLEEVQALLPKLAERRDQLASSLSGGERRMVGIGRGLMMGGRVMLIDEPSLGLAPIIIEQVYEVIARLKASGRTILLVEENPARVADLADEIHLLDNGKIVWSGLPHVLLERDELLETYLGG